MRRPAPLLALALLGACHGGAGDGEDAGESSGGPATDESGADESGEPPADPPAVAAPTIRRLTAAEFTHSVEDLLGPVTMSPVEADALQLGFFAVGAARVALSPDGVARYEQALGEATTQAFADPARVPRILACVPAAATDAACVRAAVAAFGRRAWRRPLTGAEVDRHASIATTIAAETGDPLVGLRHAVWGLLQSPNFLYRVEVGAPSPADGGRLRLSAYELASRLAFTLWSTLPDEALLDAAERGDLDTPTGLAREVERMLVDARARGGVANFIGELYALWSLAERLKDPALFPEWTPALQEAARADLLARVEDVVFTAPTDFFSLYDGHQVFVTNALARVYGLPEAQPDGLRRAALPEADPRRGLIGSAAILAMNSLPARTSATERGQFIADALLCRSVPPPPPTVDPELDDPADPGPRTLREKLARHQADPACAGCHAITDPLGLALEHFDSIGRYRATDHGLTVDVSGALDGVPYADSAELATLLRDHPDAAACLVRKLYTYAAGRAPLAGEADTLAALEDALFRDDNRFDRLLFALVTHPEFRFAQPPGTVLAQDDGGAP